MTSSSSKIGKRLSITKRIELIEQVLNEIVPFLNERVSRLTNAIVLLEGFLRSKNVFKEEDLKNYIESKTIPKEEKKDENNKV